MGLPLPPALPHGDGHVPGGARRMSTLRTLATASLLATLTTAALGQTASPPASPHQMMPGMAPGAEMPPVEDNRIFAHVLLNEFEGFRRANGEVDDGRHEFLYDRAITTYFDLQAGLRSDIDSRSTRHWGAVGIQGLAPLFFDIEATAYVSDQGHFAARFKGSYDLLITQRLVLQPEAELNLYSKADPARLVGAGFSDLDLGLRLRYEITRKFAPYIGVSYENKFGQTASLARRAGESTNGVRLLLGVRMWF